MSLPEAPRPDPHTLSDSDHDIPVVTKKKKVSRKGKMAPRSPECPSSSGHVAPVPSAQPQPTTIASPVGLPVRQENSELLEMRSLCKEMKSLTERNAAYMEMIAKAEQDRQEASVSQPVYVLEGEPMEIEQPNIEDVSHEQVVVTEQLTFQPNNEGEHLFSDLQDYGWETDEESGQPEINSNEATLVELQAAMHKPATVSTTAPVVVPKTSAPVPTVPQATGSSAHPLPRRRVFALSNNLAEGMLQNELKEFYKKMRKPVKERIDLDDDLAGAIAH